MFFSAAEANERYTLQTKTESMRERSAGIISELILMPMIGVRHLLGFLHAHDDAQSSEIVWGDSPTDVLP